MGCGLLTDPNVAGDPVARSSVCAISVRRSPVRAAVAAPTMGLRGLVMRPAGGFRSAAFRVAPQRPAFTFDGIFGCSCRSGALWALPHSAV